MGSNKTPGHLGENASLLEISFRLKKWEMYTRHEWVQKSAEELNLKESEYDANELFPVNTVTLGLTYNVLTIANTWLAIGGQMSVFHSSSQLASLYGANPVSGEFFLRIYPTLLKMKKM